MSKVSDAKWKRPKRLWLVAYGGAAGGCVSVLLGDGMEELGFFPRFIAIIAIMLMGMHTGSISERDKQAKREFEAEVNKEQTN